jgi:hypothetical protein
MAICHLFAGHVLFHHQVGDDTCGGPASGGGVTRGAVPAPGEAHVAVDHHQAAALHRSAYELSRPPEVPGGDSGVTVKYTSCQGRALQDMTQSETEQNAFHL